jgi:drug/metabolite transporter (DMT)-like permease
MRDASLSVQAGGLPAAPARAPVLFGGATAGIFCMIGATVMFAASNAIMKLEASHYPVGETMAFRSLSSLVVCSAFVLPATGLKVFATEKFGAHVARGLSQSVSQTLTVIALTMMSLAGVTAIGFSAPLFAALISILWLKERADAARIGALVAGFAGVLIVTRPGAQTFNLGALFALGNAVMYGSVTVAVRKMTKTESTLTLLMWQMVTVAAFHSLLIVFGFVLPTPLDAAIMIAAGVANVTAQYLWTKSLGLAPTTVVSPFYYMLLVWALAIGYVVWGDVATPSLLIGSAVVVLSGLALLLREMRLQAVASGRPAR